MVRDNCDQRFSRMRPGQYRPNPLGALALLFTGLTTKLCRSAQAGLRFRR
jgi:hypothetical protein